MTTLLYPGLRRMVADMQRRGVGLIVDGDVVRITRPGLLREGEVDLLVAQKAHVITLLAMPVAEPLEVPDEELDLPEPDEADVEVEDEDEPEPVEAGPREPTHEDFEDGEAVQRKDPMTGRWTLAWRDPARSAEMSLMLARGPVEFPDVGYRRAEAEAVSAARLPRPQRKGALR